VFIRLLLLFIIVPALELTLLIQLFRTTGWPFSLGLIIFTGIVGSALAKMQGLKVWRSIQSDLASGRMPGDAVVHGLLILIAGALLLTPGILTDVVGFLLLVPLTRRLVSDRLKTWFSKKVSMGTASAFTTSVPKPGMEDGLEPDVEDGDDAITVDAEVIDGE
jgi:UPF0716 protein FxsA